jgi:hypothetical protein
MVSFLLSHYLAVTGGYKYGHTDCWEGFMKYAIEMVSGAMIHIPSVIKIGWVIQKLIGGYTDRQHGNRISLFLFFQNKESRLKTLQYACVMKSIKQYYSMLLLPKGYLWGMLLKVPHMAWFMPRVSCWSFLCSSSMKVITSTIWEAAVLILLIRGIHAVHHWDGLRWHNICTKFYEDQYRHSEVGGGNTRTCTHTHTHRARWSHKPTFIF